MADTSDASLLRLARVLAKHDEDISRIYGELKAQKAASVRTKREVKAVKAATGTTARVGAVKFSSQGVQLGGLAVRRGGFSLTGPMMRGASAVPIAVGTTAAAVTIIKEVREFNRVREQWGTQEAVARVAKALPRKFGTMFRDAVIELSGEIYGDSEAAIEQRKRQARAAARGLPIIGESDAERHERMKRERERASEADRIAQAFVDEQFTRPIRDNGMQAASYVRTSREAAAIRNRLEEENRVNRAAAYKNAQEHAMRALDPLD